MQYLAAGSSDPGAAVAAVFIIVFSVILYWIPTVVALVRRHEIPNVGSIVIINLFLGWTLVGWVVALAMACRSRPQPVMMMVPAPPESPPGS